MDSFLEDDVTFDHIIFQWLGDPLFHPRLHEVIQQAQRLKGRVQYLRVDSNMILLDEDRTLSLLKGATGNIPLLLVASIDAFSCDVYTKVKGFDRLHLVRQNLRRLLRLRKELCAPVNLQLQFVVQDGNAHEAVQFREYWLDTLRCYGTSDIWHDEIMFKRLSVDGGAIGQKLADDLYEQSILQLGFCNEIIDGVQIQVWENKPWQSTEESTKDSQDVKRTACPALWSTPVIRHDGALMLCCADLEGQMTLGNLWEKRFTNLWLSEVARMRRRAHLAGQFTDKCKDCGGVNWYSLPDHHLAWS